MARITTGETFTVITNVVDKTTGNLTNAPQITLKHKTGSHGNETVVTPTNVSTGVYSASITPTESGNLHYRWDTDGIYDVAKEGVVNVAESAFT
jgi:hypothetical protein